MNITKRPRLLIFNDFFYPAYKAGGPIQSLLNLIVHLNVTYDVSVITSAYDLHTSQPMDVKMDQWSEVALPSSSDTISVWYSDKNKMLKSTISEAIKNLNPSVIYINGMFSFGFVMLPLFLKKDIKTVICPRGMIQAGALSGKYLKKQVYLFALKLSGLASNIWWHATSEIEHDDIKKIFGQKANVVLAGNIPRKPVFQPGLPDKQQGSLRLVYISLITAKKNLLLSIQAILQADKNITLDIYGPVKDISYWEKCEQSILKSNSRIIYKGPVVPANVQSTFAKYDAGLFLTKAENFGHALFESMSVGRPIICSHFTPWEDLESKKAGWNVDIDNIQEIVNTMNNIAWMDSTEFHKYCYGAHEISKEYYRKGFKMEDYQRLF